MITPRLAFELSSHDFFHHGIGIDLSGRQLLKDAVKVPVLIDSGQGIVQQTGLE
jgi:hypothetical protein